MADDGSGSGPANFVWAIALIVIVAIFAAIFFAGGMPWGGSKNVDVEIKAPSVSR
ncbi:MAG: hypothetical protein ACK4S4_04160 [Pyrinomonadaceae bacterium]